MKKLLSMFAIFALFALMIPAGIALAQTADGPLPDAGTIQNDDSPPTGEVAVDNSGGGLSAADFGNAAVTTDPGIPWMFNNGQFLEGVSTTHFNCSQFDCTQWRVQLLLCKQFVDTGTRDCGENKALRGDSSLQLYTQHFTFASGNCVNDGSNTIYYYTKARIQKNTNSGWVTKATGISKKGVTGTNCPIQ